MRIYEAVILSTKPNPFPLGGDFVKYTHTEKVAKDNFIEAFISILEKLQGDEEILSLNLLAATDVD